LALAHDPRARSFIAELKRLYPGDETWKQLINLAGEQETNLDGDCDEVRRAFAAYTIPAVTVPAAKGAAVAATVPAVATTNIKYARQCSCFVVDLGDRITFFSHLRGPPIRIKNKGQVMQLLRIRCYKLKLMSK